MALVVKDLIDAGVHFGHRASRWNPKMKPYIYGKRNLIHIIDLKETVRGLLRATKFFHRIAASGGLILFVGTKRQAAETIIEECTRGGMPFVTERWLGGTLTNFRTIRSRLSGSRSWRRFWTASKALSYSKKMISTLTRERRKIERNLSGIRPMTRLPEALMVVDPQREHIAVAEARKLGLKVVALLDTDCDPDLIDLPIPGNDDSMRSIELVMKRLIDAILEGQAAAPPEPPPSASRPRAAAIAIVTGSTVGGFRDARMAVHGSADWRHRCSARSAGARAGNCAGRGRGTRRGCRGRTGPRVSGVAADLPRNPRQAEDGDRAGPEGLTARCVQPPVETRTRPPSALGASEPDRVPVEPRRPGWCGLPATVLAASLRGRNPEGRAGAWSVEPTPHPDPKPKLHQSITDLKPSEYEHV